MDSVQRILHGAGDVAIRSCRALFPRRPSLVSFGRNRSNTILVNVTTAKRLDAELQRANRELATAYEELQSTNEELQSTVEELETTNEKLQSTNEELETMNEELPCVAGAPGSALYQ